VKVVSSSGKLDGDIDIHNKG